MTRAAPATILQALAQALRGAARFNRETECAPHCILWPDKDAQWRPVIAALQAELPELLMLGALDEEKRTGPAIWLRCAMAGQIPSIQLDGSHPPILYLPEVGRQDLRAIEHCPPALKPVAELQYRGQMFLQTNAKDWTVLAFLKSDHGGLGLDVHQDRESREAMLQALPRLMTEPLEVLRARRLDAVWFNSLLSGGDPVRDLLEWMNAPVAARAARSNGEWAAFERVCTSHFAFKPNQGELAAATKLAERAGPWAMVWQRFSEAPSRYPNIPSLIRQCQLPAFDMLANASTAGGWPQWNQAQESDLHAALLVIAQMPPHQAREQIQRLEREHCARRALVWAALGEAPLAASLEHLDVLATVTARSLAAGTLEDLQAAYAAEAWRADDAVLRALEYARSSAALAAVRAAIRCIYLPWAEDAARHVQRLVDAGRPPGGTREGRPPAYITPNQCVMFVDGLRFDLGRRLAERLEVDALEVLAVPTWVALPSVTATGKAAVSPVAHLITGTIDAAEFEPIAVDTGAPLSAQQFRRLLRLAGWQVLSGDELGEPGGNAWCEFGDIDHEGHARGWRLAQHVEVMLAEIAERIRTLLDAGWGHIRVVTDHGWLLMPGGLPKVALPRALTTTKWGRCASLKPGAHADERHFPWYWNPAQTFALADGIACYKEGEEYAHGGLSLQECLTLQLSVSVSSTASPISVVIGDVGWRGLRLLVSLDSTTPNLRADLRLRAGDSDSSVVVAVKSFSDQGTCSLVVEDEALAGSEAVLVVLDGAGALLAQLYVVIGVTA